MIRIGILATTVLIAGTLAACSSSTTSGTPTPASTATASSTPAQGTSTSLDPCQLVTASEASSVAGSVSFGPGKESTFTDANGGGESKQCLYSSGSGFNIDQVSVIVAQATDAATAQAQWSAEEQRIQSKLSQGLPAGANANFSVNDTSVSGADRAALATASTAFSGQTLNISAIYLLKGANFVGITNLVVNQPAASSATLQGQASTTLGRV